MRVERKARNEINAQDETKQCTFYRVHVLCYVCRNEMNPQTK